MGIAIKDLLALEYFRDYVVIAGRGGLNKEVQGITTLEAPDCFKWSRGKELVLSSGYVIAQEPGCIRQAFRERGIQKISGLMIKRDRYLEEIPEDMLRLFDEYEIPLISIPFSVPWMEIMSQVNIAVLNRTIRRFRIHSDGGYQATDQSYKDQKIRRILQAVEVELHFPAFLYDIGESRSYYSSTNFKVITEQFGLCESDYWNPSKPYNRYTLCDYINMSRIRLINEDDLDAPRVSWIRIPIVMNEITQAYFVVMESREFIDYYDEYSIRIAFLLLQAVYEQIMVAKNVGNIGFENFIHFAVNHGGEDQGKLIAQAGSLGISRNTEYLYVVFRQTNPRIDARSEREVFVGAFQKSNVSGNDRIAFTDENEGVILLQADKFSANEGGLPVFLDGFADRVERKLTEVRMEFGVCRAGHSITDIRECIDKCRKILKMGKIVFPKEHIWDDEMLGPLTWLDIPEKELAVLLADYRELMRDERNVELLRTLKMYLGSNMNYSVTAEKMYVHINTIRKRIDKINDLLRIDWKNPVDRIKTELLLQFLELQCES